MDGVERDGVARVRYDDDVAVGIDVGVVLDLGEVVKDRVREFDPVVDGEVRDGVLTEMLCRVDKRIVSGSANENIITRRTSYRVIAGE